MRQPTDEATGMLCEAIEGLLLSLQLQSQQPFANGDVMSAALHILVEAGMVSVEEGKSTKEGLIADICAAAKSIVESYGTERQGKTLQ